jgi:hypothetical protein
MSGSTSQQYLVKRTCVLSVRSTATHTLLYALSARLA